MLFMRAPRRKSVGEGPYRRQEVVPPTLPPRPWRVKHWALRAALPLTLLFFGWFAWMLTGWWHLPARARALCQSSPEVSEPFSLTGFRARASLLGFRTWRYPGRTGAASTVWSGLGTWIFLRCSCQVETEGGRVLKKRIRCFD